MPRRPKLPESVSTHILLESRRRCAICFGLNNDNTVKSGQIAHLDQNPRNNDPDNLVFLCLEHHDDYDRGASQSKRIQPAEVRAFRDELTAMLKLAQTADPINVLASGLMLKRSEESALRTVLAKPHVIPELREAVFALSELVAREPIGVRSSYNSRTLLVSEVAYTHFPNFLKDQQKAISSAIELCTGHEVTLVPDGGFHRVIQQQVARTSKILCVFPFFLVPSRRRDWAVLPFAWQTSVAVVLHRSHPAAIEWNDCDAHASRIANDPRSYPLQQNLEWLERLILHTAELHGTALWVQGYVQFEILLETAQRRGDSRIAAALVRTNAAVETLTTASERLLSKDHHGRSFFVIDPAEIRSVCRHLDDEFQVVMCTHDVNIPVGVGFSLPSLLMLLTEDRWRTILKAARQQYTPFAEDFEALGIRFSNRIA